MKDARHAAEQFVDASETIISITAYGEGLIHDTYLVTLLTSEKQFILQRINDRVFTDPGSIMHNLKVVTRHIQERKKSLGSRIAAEWQMLQGLTTRSGTDFFIDEAGKYWRALNFISQARPLQHISGPGDAREAGRALGTFHLLTNDLDPRLLKITLPGFHNMEHYLRQYDELAGRSAPDRTEEFCRNFIAQRRNWAPVLERARREAGIRAQVIHGDPKIDNIMVDSCSGRAVSIIDLDTVMPGLVHYDIGDALRSCCNKGGENAGYPVTIHFDLESCRAFWSGYLEIAGQLVTAGDLEFLYDAIRLVPFELGLRFYTDFLAGNRYFRADRRGQNLERAEVQFRLTESIELQESEIRTLIEPYSGGML